MRQLLLILALCPALLADWVYLPGKGPYVNYLDALPISTAPPTFTSTGMVLDTASKKAAITGRVWFPARSGSKTITKIHWRFRNVSITSSTIQVSLQDVLTTGNPPAVPDGTADQTATVLSSDPNLASDTWYPGAALGTGRTVTYGERLAVVWEFSSYTGSDSFSLSTVAGVAAIYYGLESHPVVFGGSSWAVFPGIPIVMLEFSDGTFGTIEGAIVWSDIVSTAFNSTTSEVDEYGIAYTPAFTQKIDGIWGMLAVANLSNPEICIYNSSGEMLPGYPTYILSSAISNNSSRFAYIAVPEATLVAGQKYYLTLRPTSTTNTTIHAFTVADADYLSVVEGGNTIAEAKRVDLGTFTEDPTRRPFLGFRISALETTEGGLPATGEHSVTVVQ